MTAGVDGTAATLYAISTRWTHASFVGSMQLYLVMINMTSILVKGLPPRGATFLVREYSRPWQSVWRWARSLVATSPPSVYELPCSYCASWVRGASSSRVRPLVLLCHKFIGRVVHWQHGHRGRVRLMARAIVIRTDVIEFGTGRSGLIGRSAGSITTV
jgi:hypothetical protein